MRCERSVLKLVTNHILTRDYEDAKNDEGL